MATIPPDKTNTILMKTTNKITTQLAAMFKEDIFGRSKNKTKIADSPGRKLPSVSKFEIILSEINELLDEVGLTRRLPNAIKSKIHKNRQMNKYAEYMIIRMNRAKEEGNYIKYGFIANFLIRHSVSFRIMAINHTLKNWFKDLPFDFVMNICRKVDSIIKDKSTNIDFKRVYIPKKAEDVKKLAELLESGRHPESIGRRDLNWRGLGVPTHAWRVVLHMHSNFLTQYYKDVIHKDQHAYLPGRGTLTAITSLFEKIDKWDYIYEIDLKQCFPSINGRTIVEQLINWGMPGGLAEHYERMNLSTPGKARYDRGDERMEEKKKAANKGGRMAGIKSYSELYEVQLKAMEEGLTEDQIYRKLGDLVGPAGVPNKVANSHTGLPQGANTSPVLTELGINDGSLTYGKDRLFYADDGIFFSDEPISVRDDPVAGIYVHKEKSGYVKYAGEGLKPVKFLGVIYDGPTSNIGRAERDQEIEGYGDNVNNVFSMLKEIKPEYSWDLKKLFNKTTLGGSVLTRIYNNTGKLRQYDREESFFGIANSGVRNKGRTALLPTTSSDAVMSLAQIIRNKWSQRRISKPKRDPNLVLLFKGGRYFYVKRKRLAVVIRPKWALIEH